MEADAADAGWWLWAHELFDGFDEDQDLIIMVAEFTFELRNLMREFFVTGDHFPKLYKCTYYINAYFHRSRRIENTRDHDCAMFCEGVWKGLGELEF